jgi:hypothetical protein
MKLHKSLILTLLAAGSLIMGSAQAQEKLFTAQMGTRADTNASLEGSVYSLGSQKETFGILIHTEQRTYIPNPPVDYNGDGIPDYSYGSSYKYDNTLKIFSVAGTELKNLSSVIPAGSDFNYVSVEVRPLGGGGFVLQVYGAPKNYTGKSLNDYIVFSRVGTDWVETNRFKVDSSDKASIQDGGVFENGMSPAGMLAFFRNDQSAIVADVYTSDKAALTPAQITSDLSTLVLKTDKAMKAYTTTASFPTTGFIAFGLPPGLKFNAGNGQISGKPTDKGTYSVVIGALRSGDGPILATKIIRVK